MVAPYQIVTVKSVWTAGEASAGIKAVKITTDQRLEILAVSVDGPKWLAAQLYLWNEGDNTIPLIHGILTPTVPTQANGRLNVNGHWFAKEVDALVYGGVAGDATDLRLLARGVPI